MKTIQKSDFCKDKLTEMSPGDNILVVCNTFKEIDSVKQICYNTKLREPREDVSAYKTDRDSSNMYVLITAIPTTTKF